MTLCRFEDRLAGTALAMYEPCGRIEARRAGDLPRAFAAIEDARRAGRWIALLLDYELGEWLEPAVAGGTPEYGAPLLAALCFRRAAREAPWGPPDPGQAARVVAVAPRIAKAGYLRNVHAIRERIAAGDFYQVNYTFRQDVTVAGPLTALYRTIACQHPSAHAAYIEDAGRTVLSFSPELFLQRRGTRLATRPMKGTAPRHADPVLDGQSGHALQASTKDRAENLMIVDLLRNDLGRLARPGSVQVTSLFDLERYPSVWTLTSTVCADVPDAPLPAVLQALFPCGSVTGAPKIAAMRCIRELESDRRGLYCGSVGWLAPDGDFALNVAIRTLVVGPDGRGVYGAGGGIVADSDPEQEWLECQWKSRILETAA